ncbi:MAG: peptidase [Chromatiaceae bacterium]|nr:peptidase [Chromatiaceae bacterium]MCP5438619.1 peptidase [Chromatiaceae bacterium]MCP5440588.1 peptidase [Chromatiaceae bacterium]
MNRILMLVAGLALNMPLHAAMAVAVLDHYADLAHAMYSDALTGAQALQQQVDAFLARPTEQNLAAARTAWVAARHPYQQTEAYRFGNPIVDDWEGKVNAWPLDEGLIDYTAASYGGESDENPLYTANVIANRTLTVGGRTVDASRIDKALLSETLHEIDEVETNVATGYHAIEFLLWGQDLNGTGPGAGARPASDYDPASCSWGNCDRRADYLRAVTGLLVDELQWMVDQWTDGGAARLAVTTGDLQKNLATIFTGMGSLSYGELAGERMKLGLMLHDPEEEHDCFSDNTHWSHYDDALGIRNVYTGAYTRIDGSVLSGPSLSDLVAARDAAADRALRDHLDATMAAMQVLVDTAQGGEAYDQMIGEGNTSGNAKVKAAVDALVAQTRAIEKAVNAMGLGSIAFEGSDSLDAPEKVN